MGRNIFGVVVGLFFLYISSPLILPVAMGGVIAVLFIPWLNHLERKRIPPAIGSALLTAGITVVLIFPASLLLFFAIKTGIYQLQNVTQSSDIEMNLFDRFINMPKVHEAFDWIVDRAPVNMEELSSTAKELATSVGSKLAELFGGILTHIPGIVFTLAVMVVSVYVFLMDGRRMVGVIRSNRIFNRRETDQMLKCVAETCRSVLLAAVASGASQALIEVIACIITGRSNVAMIGLLVFVASFIPVVGSAPITLGIAVQQFLEGNSGLGFVLLAVALLIMGIDNYIRPMFLKGTTQLHPMVAFVSALGGLQTLGFTGVFLGPIVAALFFVIFRILTENDRVKS